MSLDPMRVRRPSRGFGWIDHRVLSGGYLAHLDCTQIATYFTLCLVADRHGISFYRPDSLARILKRPAAVVGTALAALDDCGLIARDGRHVQVRDLDDVQRDREVRPAARPSPAPPTAAPSPAEPAEVTLAGLAPVKRERLLQRAREQFRRFMGAREPSTGALAAVAVGLLRDEEASCPTRS